MSQKINYSEIMKRGFTEEKQTDNVFFDEHGFDYTIITRNLNKKIYLDWEKETKLCQLIRMNKDYDIKKKVNVTSLEQLDAIIDFYTDTPDTVATCSATYEGDFLSSRAC